MGMLGDAANGTFQPDGTIEQFQKYYLPLWVPIRRYSLDCLDLDVEECMSPLGYSLSSPGTNSLWSYSR